MFVSLFAMLIPSRSQMGNSKPVETMTRQDVLCAWTLPGRNQRPGRVGVVYLGSLSSVVEVDVSTLLSITIGW